MAVKNVLSTERCNRCGAKPGNRHLSRCPRGVSPDEAPQAYALWKLGRNHAKADKSCPSDADPAYRLGWRYYNLYERPPLDIKEGLQPDTRASPRSLGPPARIVA